MRVHDDFCIQQAHNPSLIFILLYSTDAVYVLDKYLENTVNRFIIIYIPAVGDT